MRSLLLLGSMLACLLLVSTDTFAVHTQSKSEKTEAAESESMTKAERAEAKKLRKAQKRLERKQRKAERKQHRLAKLLTKLQQKAAAGDASGVGLALVIILVGALLAVLGFIGIADLLITIGIVVLAVGLVIWLITAIT